MYSSELYEQSNFTVFLLSGLEDQNWWQWGRPSCVLLLNYFFPIWDFLSLPTFTPVVQRAEMFAFWLNKATENNMLCNHSFERKTIYKSEFNHSIEGKNNYTTCIGAEKHSLELYIVLNTCNLKQENLLYSNTYVNTRVQIALKKEFCPGKFTLILLKILEICKKFHLKDNSSSYPSRCALYQWRKYPLKLRLNYNKNYFKSTWISLWGFYINHEYSAFPRCFCCLTEKSLVKVLQIWINSSKSFSS